MKKRLLALILGLSMAVGMLSGCGTYTDTAVVPEETAVSDTADAAEGTDEETSSGASSLTFVSTEPNTLNMIQAASNLDASVFYLISAMLYRPYDGVAYPELCEGYTVSDDGLTYTYTIKDAVYSDGTPIAAADFVYYMIQTLSAETAIYYRNGEAYYNGECDASEVGIYAVDDHTFAVELSEAIADYDPQLEIYPLRQEFAESKGDSLGGTPEDLMYSGPYILTEWVYGSYLQFEKNPSYIAAEDSFPLESLRMIHSTDESGRYAMFQAGEADILTSVSEETYQLMPESCGHAETSAVQGLEFNTTGYCYNGTEFVERDPEVTALLSNQNFRLALSYALNREAIVSVVSPSGRAYNRFVSSLAAGNEEDSLFVEDYPIEAVPMTGDAQKAKEYLAAALEELGYSDVSELPEVSYLTFDSDKYRLMAETLQSEWKNVLGLENIVIELQPVSDAVMSMVYMDYDIYYQSLTSDTSNPRYALEFWMTGGSVSDAMGAGAPFSSIYSDSAFDELVSGAKYEYDRTARMSMLAEAEQMFIDSNIFIPIMVNGVYYAVSDRVEGFVWNESEDAYEFNHTTVK